MAILFAVPDRVPCEWASRCAGTSDLCLCDSIDSAFSVSGAGVHGWNGKLSGRDQPCIGNPDPAIILCLTIGLVLGEVFDFRRVIALIGQAILAVVRVIAMVIGLFYHYISFWFRGGEAETSEHQQFDDGDVPSGIRSVGQTLEPVLYVGLICLGLFIAYKVLVRFVRFLMARRNISTDQVELVVVKKKKEEQRTHADEKRRFLSRRQRARRCYKDCIERYCYDIALEQSKTGREIETELNEQSLADVTELTRCYEDIRYGDAEVDRALLQKMRRLSSR